MSLGSAIRLQLLTLVFAGSLGLSAHAGEVSEISATAFVIADGRLVDGPEVFRVTQNQLVRMQWRSDREVELHLHGYDREVIVPKGGTVVLELQATATGRYPLTLHTQDGRHHATLIYLEVHPN